MTTKIIKKYGFNFEAIRISVYCTVLSNIIIEHKPTNCMFVLDASDYLTLCK